MFFLCESNESTGFFAGIRNRVQNAINSSDTGVQGFLSISVLFWAIWFIIALCIAWIILHLFGHSFRLWVVPTFSTIAIIVNMFTLPMPILETIPIQAAVYETIPYTIEPTSPSHHDAIEVIMTEGMRSILSLPTMVQTPNFLFW